MLTWAFTLASAIALAITLRKLRTHLLNRSAAYDPVVIARLEPPKLEDLRLVSRFLVLRSIALNVINAILLLVGVGSLTGHYEFGWALVVLPALSVVASIFDPV